VVSAGLAAFSIGSDTRGSIICPTSWCGIAGMRPSFGRVSRHGAMAIAWSMDKLGPMARTAHDCGLILSAIAGHDPRDHDSLPEALAGFPYPSPPPEPRKPLRIGKVINAWPPNPALETVIDDALRVMEKNGAKIADAKIPEGPYEDAAELTILMEAASSFRNLIHSGDCAGLRDPLGQINGYVSEEFSASDYLDVQRIRAVLQRRVDALFDRFDVLAAAGSDTAARPLARPPAGAGRGGRGRRDEVNQSAPDGVSSLCGLPALSVPCGFSAEGLPYGLQFIARALHDHAVVAAGRSYQELTDWHRRHPS
jgi:aspartyl-tRNA(Asn)/glutamyl-tRNA(Gln) amidotransferase subunit A